MYFQMLARVLGFAGLQRTKKVFGIQDDVIEVFDVIVESSKRLVINDEH